MTIPLRYGNPPEDGEYIGEVTPPTHIDNSPGSGMGGNEDIYNSYGIPLPVRSQIRWVLMNLEEVDMPFKVDVVGVGQLIVGERGWQVV